MLYVIFILILCVVAMFFWIYSLQELIQDERKRVIHLVIEIEKMKREGVYREMDRNIEEMQ